MKVKTVYSGFKKIYTAHALTFPGLLFLSCTLNFLIFQVSPS